MKAIPVTRYDFFVFLGFFRETAFLTADFYINQHFPA